MAFPFGIYLVASMEMWVLEAVDLLIELKFEAVAVPKISSIYQRLAKEVQTKPELEQYRPAIQKLGERMGRVQAQTPTKIIALMQKYFPD
jgi:hypothetical protein